MTCTDCGCDPAHPLCLAAGKTLCRYCAEKGGYMYLFRVTIDTDKLRMILRPSLAQYIIDKAQVDE